MAEEELFVKIRMWAEINDDGSIANVRYKYKLPKIDSDLVLELYGIFLETLCGEIATLEGSEKLLEKAETVEEIDEDK
ncbi:MAG: hypothetical protein ACXADW_23010 [Candidatus Hodarchaeales archaeon]